MKCEACNMDGLKAYRQGKKHGYDKAISEKRIFTSQVKINPRKRKNKAPYARIEVESKELMRFAGKRANIIIEVIE